MTGSSLFGTAMSLTPVEGCEGVYDGVLDEHWTIGPKLHGGAMLALCAKAAREALGGQERSDPGIGTGGQVQPVAVSANFLSAPDPGPMRLVTSIRKRGRRISLVDVELQQGRAGDERSREEQRTASERTAVHAVVTLGEPEHLVTPLLSVNPVTPLMAPEPPSDVAPIGPGHPSAEIVHLFHGCDIRPITEPSIDGGAPQFKIWVRPRDAAPDVLFALMCGDISVPVAYAVDRRGWAPTVQLTAYLRGLPADGWLRVLCTTTQIGQDWFDEDHTVVDCEGRIIVQTRQLALVPTE